jgi:hypothetical protein
LTPACSLTSTAHTVHQRLQQQSSYSCQRPQTSHRSRNPQCNTSTPTQPDSDCATCSPHGAATLINLSITWSACHISDAGTAHALMQLASGLLPTTASCYPAELSNQQLHVQQEDCQAAWCLAASTSAGSC